MRLKRMMCLILSGLYMPSSTEFCLAGRSLTFDSRHQAEDGVNCLPARVCSNQSGDKVWMQAFDLRDYSIGHWFLCVG